MKKNLIQIILKKYPKLKNKNLNLETDLIEDRIFDSLEIFGFLSFLEKVHKFNYKKFMKKNKKFIIKLIQKELS